MCVAVTEEGSTGEGIGVDVVGVALDFGAIAGSTSGEEEMIMGLPIDKLDLQSLTTPCLL